MQIVLNITQKTFFLVLTGIITVLLAVAGTAAVFHKSEQVQAGTFGTDAGAGPASVYVFTGSVGIGNITNPGSASLNVSKNISINSSGAGIVFADGTFMETAAVGGTSDGVVNSTAWNRTLTNVILHNIGDFVGIGTATPAEKLHVEGNTTIKGNLTVGSGTVFIDGSSNRVGIGTTSPSENLHVTGNSTLKGNLTIWNENSVGAGMVFIDSSSNNTVGIGTQTPQEMLHVQGNATIKGNLTVGSGTVIIGDNAIRPGADSTTALQIRTKSGTNVLNVDTTNQRVGIGTASPGTTLDAAGSIRTNSQLISTVTTGTAPLSVSSATKVSNLNTDKLDDLDSIDFQRNCTTRIGAFNGNGQDNTISMPQSCYNSGRPCTISLIDLFNGPPASGCSGGGAVAEASVVIYVQNPFSANRWRGMGYSAITGNTAVGGGPSTNGDAAEHVIVTSNDCQLVDDDSDGTPAEQGSTSWTLTSICGAANYGAQFNLCQLVICPGT